MGYPRNVTQQPSLVALQPPERHLCQYDAAAPNSRALPLLFAGKIDLDQSVNRMIRRSAELLLPSPAK